MKKSIQVAVLAAVILILVLVLYGVYRTRFQITQVTEQQSKESGEEEKEKLNAGLYAGINKTIQENIFDSGIVTPGFRAVVLTPSQQADRVYTFLQGPKSYEEKRPWSGSWCETTVGWNTFGGFGCGHCCMANIYSTLSPYECSPLDMYQYAMEVSQYAPSEESGAIDWKDMKKTLRAAGFTSFLHKKPNTYEKFQKQMEEAKSAIVLVSSYNDDGLWENTGGHYVNIWLYQPESDMVFLAEPGAPDLNRTWIPLRYVYDALKTSSHFQYLSVIDYSEEKNEWKWDGIQVEWNGKS